MTILTRPSKKSKSCKSSGSRGRTSEKSSWFNSKSCGMSVISLAMSSGNSSALSSGVDGLLGETTWLAPALPFYLHTSVTETGSSSTTTETLTPNPNSHFRRRQFVSNKTELTIHNHISTTFIQILTHPLQDNISNFK